MFGKRHSGRRSANPLFVIFRLALSIVMLAALLGGVYSAYKHFSGLDPFKLDPQTVISNLLSSKSPKDLIASLSSIKLGQKVLGQSKQNQTNISLENLTKPNIQKAAKLAFNFVLIADSHNDNVNLKKALVQAKEKNPAFVIGLGDYTEVGTIQELQAAKKAFDSPGLRYFLTPGDHDLWDSRNRNLSPNANFREVFGPSYQSFSFGNFRFIILYNSDNYIGMDQEQLNWMADELQKAKNDQSKAIYVFVHEPLYHPSSDHVMGRVETKLKEQAKSLVHVLAGAGVKKVFFGDIHYFTEYIEPETNLSMVTVGAITSERNSQAPRFAVVWVFEDGSAKVEDVEVK